MEEIPEDLRCKRSDGKQWRCSALSMPDKTVCEKHYIQAKKRAANSALRASLKKARRVTGDSADAVLESKSNEAETSRPMSPVNADGLEYKKSKEKLGRNQGMFSSDGVGVKGSVLSGCSLTFSEEQRDAVRGEEDRIKPAYNSLYLRNGVNNFGVGGHGEHHRKSSELGEADGLTCHHCRRNDGVNVVWCISCDRKGYCGSCISQWYADIPIEDIRKICPACRGICSCKVCLRGDNLIKTKVQEIAALDKLRHLHSLLSYVLPVLKHIYAEQCFEIAVETKVHGMKTDIPRADIHADEQMCCNLCRIPIFDFHRHCTKCLYDLCLTCCRDIRRASLGTVNGEPAAGKRSADKLMGLYYNENAIDFSHLFPKWNANSDGSIPCAPEDAGGCGSSRMTLRRILKINWVAKLVKNSEEMVTGCKVSGQILDHCASCTERTSLALKNTNDSVLQYCSLRNSDSHNRLYYPTSEDLKHEGISHFHKHWVKGEPVIVKQVFDHSLASSWDPMSIWRGIKETAYERLPQTNTDVKVIDFSSQSEVNIDLIQFIKGYSEGLRHEDGWPKMLMLRDWPLPNAWEEFILCQRPEFLTNLPFVEFIHSKWGLLNLAAKLPHDTMQTEAGPKIYISYGTHEELGRGGPVSNLCTNMGDLVHLLMHSVEPTMNQKDSSVEEKKSVFPCPEDRSGDVKKEVSAGAIWDVFHRQDVSKLNEFLRSHWQELTNDADQPIAFPIYDQSVYLDKHLKRKLKDDYGIEPWTFEQSVGEAVFVPAGCPFQIRNLQSTVQLGLDFLTPESLSHSTKMAQEIRCLPDDHKAKLTMWEMGKMSLYAASSAIREIQKIVLDPKMSSDIKFEDHNLTAMVSANLEKMARRRGVACA